MVYFRIFITGLTTPCRRPLMREHLSLNVSWFSYEQTQKRYNFLEKLIRKKIQKNFKVNNNNKIICAWYLSSKWLVCRSIVNQTNGGTSRTKLSTLLKTNIFKYCPLFFNKVAKVARNSFNCKCIFVLFRSFFPGEQNYWFILFLNFVSPNSCVMLLTVLKHDVHI